MSKEFEVLVLEFLGFIAQGVVIGNKKDLNESLVKEFIQTCQKAAKFCNNHKST